jgi:hypothetical protein
MTDFDGFPSPAIQSFIMVDVTASHLPRLLQDPAFKEYQSTESNSVPSKQARLVVHRITDEVMQDERYMAWVRSFGKDTNVSFGRRSDDADRRWQITDDALSYRI